MTIEEIKCRREKKKYDDQCKVMDGVFGLISDLWTPYVKTKCIDGNGDICISTDNVVAMMSMLKIINTNAEDLSIDNCIKFAWNNICERENQVEEESGTAWVLDIYGNLCCSNCGIKIEKDTILKIKDGKSPCTCPRCICSMKNGNKSYKEILEYSII